MGFENVPRCQHVKVNGVQCGSPALRRKPHCYFHERVQYERELAAQNKSGQRKFGFPLLEDANSIQVALMKVIQMIGSGMLDHKTAGLLLYALQTASANLRYAKFEPEPTDVVIDEDTVDLTRVEGPQWCVHDFKDSKKEVTLPAEPAAPPSATAKNSAASGALDEAVADIARRREQKRKLLDRPESEEEPSLAKILLDRMGIVPREENAAEEGPDKVSS